MFVSMSLCFRSIQLILVVVCCLLCIVCCVIVVVVVVNNSVLIFDRGTKKTIYLFCLSMHALSFRGNQSPRLESNECNDSLDSLFVNIVCSYYVCVADLHSFINHQSSKPMTTRKKLNNKQHKKIFFNSNPPSL